MGMFGLFGRKSKTNGSPSPNREPRCHHYALAHYAIRQAFLDDPLRCLGILASNEAQKFLNFLFESVSEMCDKQKKEDPGFDATDLRVHRVRVGGYPCAVIEFPRPGAITEVYFTALVAYIDPASEIGPDTVVPARYFTLELGFSMDGTERTVLCEWTKTAHSNMGDGPKPTLEDFVNSIASFGPPRAE
jgi:hypothetical protein